MESAGTQPNPNSRHCTQPESVCCARERRSVRRDFFCYVGIGCSEGWVGSEQRKMIPKHLPHRPGRQEWSETLIAEPSGFECGRIFLARAVSCIGSSSHLAVTCQYRAVPDENARPKPQAQPGGRRCHAGGRERSLTDVETSAAILGADAPSMSQDGLEYVAVWLRDQDDPVCVECDGQGGRTWFQG